MLSAKLLSALKTRSRLAAAAAVLSLACICPMVNSQETSTETAKIASAVTRPVIPQQVRFSGTLPNRAGDTVEAVFRIYSGVEGGEALWTETQKIAVAQDGSYSVLLGAASAKGLPETVFGNGRARWVGIAVERGEEQARISLASAPYAMKAGDAQTLGGLSARSYVTQAQLATAARALAEQASALIAPAVTPTGSGTTNYLPLWTSSSALGNSVLYQSSSKIGIGTTAPLASLHVMGPATAAIAAVVQGGSGSGALKLGADVNTNTLTPSVRKLARITMPDWAADSLGITLFSGDVTGVNANDLYFGGTPNGSQYAATGLHFVTAATGTTTGGSEKMIVTNAGNVGIGTLTPATKLEVNGTAKFDGNVTFASGQTFPAGGGVNHNATLTGTGATTSPLGVTVPLSLSGSANGVVSGTDTGGGMGVVGSSATGVGVYGNESGIGSFGVEGVAAGADATGVFGNTSTLSATGQEWLAHHYAAGVWGDTNQSYTSEPTFALFGTSDDDYTAILFNNSDTYHTLFANNSSSSVSAPVAYFGGSGGNCTFDSSGDFYCSGTKSSVVKVDQDTRKVALYAVEAPGVWFEDYGSGELAAGSVTVSFEHTFAQTVNVGMDYKVFLTPNGDCKGLYVTNKTANGFEVRELGGGKSSVAFDYRIIARRKGFENVRLADRTKESEGPMRKRPGAKQAAR